MGLKSSGATLMTQNLKALQDALSIYQLDGFIVPRTDEYQNEYVPAWGDRLPWLSGFKGSAGIAIVTPQKAAIFVDGRYILEAQELLTPKGWQVYNSGQVHPLEWALKNIPAGGKLGFDPWITTIHQQETYSKVLQGQLTLTPIFPNPIDRLWREDRPTPQASKVVAHPLMYAGKSHSEKKEGILKELQKNNLDAYVFTSLESIAWFLNIRGSDVPNTPLVLARMILTRNGKVYLYGSFDTPPPEVHVMPMDLFTMGLEALHGQKVGVCPESSFALLSSLRNSKVQLLPDPCLLPKALKNQTELQGMRDCHIQDGAALCEFLCWLSTQAPGTVMELSASKKLLSFRQKAKLFQGVSFDTIPGSGPHGAIIHYHPTIASNRLLGDGELFLLDSGGQYLNGTTDVTRTVLIGNNPTRDQIHHFTLVLKGHIAIAKAVFPKGKTTGHALDILARQALWNEGLDYDHGTGHGVGCYLNVHEGPQSISSRSGGAVLEPGMIISNEPGYYRPGHYGIRIENLVEVVDHSPGWLGFKTLTQAPIDMRLVDQNLLLPEEKSWLRDYQKSVYETLKELVSPETQTWLKNHCFN